MRPCSLPPIVCAEQAEGLRGAGPRLAEGGREGGAGGDAEPSGAEEAAAAERAGGGRERRKRATEGRARWLDRVLATLLSVPTASLMR